MSHRSGGRRLRALLYLRQSVTREDSISIELQEAACRRHCEANGYDVVGVEADPGVSGRTFNRPAVKRVLEQVEAGRADVVVLWKWSRWSRSRRDWAVAADTIDMAGGRIESATEDLDVTTSHGRLARGMLVEFAAFESERIGDQWKEAHSRRVRNGLPANGKARFGYKNQGKRFTPDPETGPYLAEAYQRYTAGSSIISLVKWLNNEGVLTAAGYMPSDRSWSQHTLRRVLDSGFGAGFIRSHGDLLEGAHEAVITLDEWEAYQGARAARRGKSNTERSQYLLSGMVRCSCGAAMVGGKYSSDRKPRFRCAAAAQKSAHPGGYIEASILEAVAVEWLQSLVSEVEYATSTAMRLQKKHEEVTASLPRLAERVTNAEAAITRLTVSMAEGVLSADAYRSALVALEDKRDRAVVAYESAASSVRKLPGSVSTVAGELLRLWEVLPLSQRREALRGLVGHIVVGPKGQTPRSRIVPVWDL